MSMTTKYSIPEFQSTLPARGATIPCTARGCSATFQSTLPARGATRLRPRSADQFLISIHAPRTGSDSNVSAFTFSAFYFNPRSPHGERPKPRSLLSVLWHISIHAPRTGSDKGKLYTVALLHHFNPRSPHGERLHWDRPKTSGKGISIHAPRTGSDKTSGKGERLGKNFNPRSPHGERLVKNDSMGRDHNFNPRSPHGERHPARIIWHMALDISIHAPRTGSDFGKPMKGSEERISIHAPRTGSD